MTDLAAVADSPPETRRSQAVTTAFLAFLGILLAFGIDVALPAFDEISDAFGLDRGGSSVSLVGTVYFLGLAVGQLVYGPVSDRFGRLPGIQIGLGLYAIGALGAALAPSFGWLLAARALWGFGAAGPGALRIAMARDLYEGDQMAQVVTIVMAVFMIGPIFVPIIGEGLLSVGPWETVFLAALALCLAASGFAAVFAETLPPDRRRPLRVEPVRLAARAVFTNRRTMGYVLAQTFFGAAFFIYLGSSQPVIDQIYGRAELFAPIFGALGVVMVVFLVINNRLIPSLGSQRLVAIVSAALVAVCLAGVLLALATDGVPGLWWWVVWAGAANALITTSTPMCSALALEPMGAQAGMASAVLGAVTLAGGALLAASVDRMIDSTITPMTVGYLAFAILGSLCVAWAQGAPAHA